MAITPVFAAAYCGIPSVAEKWSLEAYALEIPVYVSIHPLTTVEHTGLTAEDFARVVIDSIARHNEVVVAPKLLFAGFTGEEFAVDGNPVELRPGGITIQSFDCGSQMMEALCPPGTLACAFTGLNSGGARVSTITLDPEQCRNVGDEISWRIAKDSLANTRDPIRVVLHEFGHALGLQHTNVADGECMGPEGGVPGPSPGPNEGTMRTVGPAHYQTLRTWRRDDLDGLDAIYAPFAGMLRSGPVWWSDDNFPDVPDVSAGIVLAEKSHTAPVASSSGWGSLQVVAWTDEQRRVVRALVDDQGQILDQGVIDPGDTGKSWGIPTVAVGRIQGLAYEIIGWTSGETTKSVMVTPRWAIRELPGGDWSYHEAADQLVPRFQLGVDDMEGGIFFARFNSDSQVIFSLIDVDGLVIDEVTVEAQVSDVGAPACVERRCDFPIKSANVGGPRFGRVKIEAVDGALAAVVGPSGEMGLDTFGRVGMAVDEAGMWRAVAGSQRFQVASNDVDGVGGPVPVPLFLEGRWPTSVGALADGGMIHHSLVTNLIVECGNGVVQAGEECDDANGMAGDGCDVECMLERGGGFDETGGGIAEEGNGCECSVGDGLGKEPWVMVFWGAVVASLRRRK